MTIVLHEGDGARLAVTGAATGGYEMRFDAAEVATLLAGLTRAVAYDRDAIITVAGLADINGDHSYGWAWHIADGTPWTTTQPARCSTPTPNSRARNSRTKRAVA
ncbi:MULTISPECIES: hypothetical protein [unclassified Streptomyces]|uniref:hypothetical protein n=1 Tax=unclassified Streptomyces TaxID=2593676 RepID=UPI0029BAD717|nr:MULTISPECIES: hypothetical protein [unclassified Streptomyces]MDX3772386.1 hypothetical protein [Streptomyces sp. AK08-01B]MDX3821884.1 hypothetical protein [Streptomyces sp. AK08-01A]